MSDPATMTAEEIRVELTTALCRQLTAAVEHWREQARLAELYRAREEQGVAHLRAQRNDLQTRNTELVEQRRAAVARAAALSSPAEGTFREGVEAAARIVELTPSLVRAVIARQIRALSPAPTGCCLVAHHTGGREHDPYCKTPAAPKATT